MSSIFAFDPDLMTGSGIITRGTAGEALTGHQLVYQGTNGRWYLADADAASTMPTIGLTLYSINSGSNGQILLHGYIGLASWTWTVGGITGLIYASTTPGALTQTAPSGAGDYVQVVGTATASNIIYFNPFPPSEGIGIGKGIAEFTYLVERTNGTYTVYDNRGNLVSGPGADADTQINWALTTGGAGAVIALEADTTFPINDPITFTANSQWIRGGGRGTLIDGDGLATGEHGIELSGFDDCIMSNFSIQTQDAGTKTCHCIFIENGADRFLIENVTFVDSDHSDIWIEGTTIEDGHIHNCKLLDADNDCIYVDIDDANYLYRLKITDCEITGGGARGIMFAATTGGYPYTLIQGNTIHDNGYEGIFVYDFEHCTIEENIIYSNGWSGIHVNTTADDCRVMDNECYSNGRHGIYFANVDNSQIEGNTCVANDSGDTATYDGIFTDSSSTDNTIEGNECYLNHAHGIWVEGLRNQIVNCKAQENDLEGIRVTSGECVVEGNYVSDNSQDAAGASHGILLMGSADRCLVIGNYVDGYGDSQEDGIHLNNGATEVLIEGNHCYDGMGSGIALAASNDDCSIIGNYLMNNDDYGIEISAASCDRNLVKENYFSGNVTGQFLDSGTDTRTPWVFSEVTDPDSNVGDHPALVLPDTVDTTFRFQIPVPLEFQELVTAHVIVVQTVTAAGPPDMQWSTTTDWGKLCVGENYNAGTDGETDQTTAVAQNNLVCIDVSASLDGIAAGDLVGFAFIRRATQAGDTINADAYYMGFRMRYI